MPGSVASGTPYRKDRKELVRTHSTGQTRGKYAAHGENPNKNTPKGDLQTRL